MTDQRNSLKTKAISNIKNINKLEFNNKNIKQRREFGRLINLLSKSFNQKFVDDIDIDNFNIFIDTIKNVITHNHSYRTARKVFKNYKVADIVFNNYKKLGKEYVVRFFEDTVRYLFTNLPMGMQAHRDIIDICKSGYNKTSYIECYYFLGRIINNMCICCFKPSNASKTAIKYYKMCVDNSLKCVEMYCDLFEIYVNEIKFKSETSTDINDSYFEGAKMCYEKYKLLKDDETMYLHAKKNSRNTYECDNEILLECAIILEKHDYINDYIKNNDIFELYPHIFVDLLTYFYKHNIDMFNDNIKKLKENNNIESLRDVYEKLEMYDVAKDYMIQMLSCENKSNYPDYKYINDILIKCPNLTNIDYDKLTENIIKIKNKIVKNNQHSHIIKSFFTFSILISKLHILQIKNDNEIIILLDIFFENNYLNSFPSADNYLCYDNCVFGIHRIENYDMAKVIIDYVSEAVNIIIKKRPQYIEQIKYAMINGYFYISGFGCYTTYLSNPFDTKDETTTLNVNEKTNNTPWDFVTGNDDDYDTVYDDYSSYYNAIYGMTNDERRKDKEKVDETNYYIQNKLKILKEKIKNIQE